MKNKLHIRKGDTVKVLAGDSRGKTGKVLEILGDKNKALIEGLNIVTRHLKPTASRPEGSTKKTEAGIHLSNLMLVDPASGKATRIGRKRNDKGKWQRYAKSTGELIK